MGVRIAVFGTLHPSDFAAGTKSACFARPPILSPWPPPGPFLADASPLSAKFIEYEMHADFLADLAADIAAFDEAEDDQDAGLTNRVGATRSVVEAIMGFDGGNIPAKDT